MIFDLHNPTPSLRIFFDANRTQRFLHPHGGLTEVTLIDKEADRLRACGMEVTSHTQLVMEPVAPGAPKHQIIIDGMWGIGDNLHQRAVVRELMKTHEVWLSTCHYLVYHDLIEQGLKLIFKSTGLRAQAKTIARERGMFPNCGNPPVGAKRIKLWYHRVEIERDGSIVETLMTEGGCKGVQPDFSMPIRPEWREAARKLIAGWDMGGKPLMVYRPIVMRREWNGSARNPDPEAYAALFQSIREKFFVVSLADLENGKEWIVGPEQEVDVKLHAGQLDFQTMAALFAEANLFFGNAGFGPVLAQAVGTPGIVVYGGRESYKTTERGGEHLAPTLGISPDVPCDRHNDCKRDVTIKTPNGGICPCNKHITLPPALDKVREFADKYCAAVSLAQDREGGRVAPSAHGSRGEAPHSGSNILIFATTYVDSDDRVRLTDQWLTLTRRLNPDCDILIVDTASPRAPFIDPKHGEFSLYQAGVKARQSLFSFPDNVGHLSRRGRDGWGRAFSFGLQAAIDCGYEYAVHIEGDSLFRLPVSPLIEEMKRDRIKVASIPVVGTDRVWSQWVETGLMFFRTDWLKDKEFIKKYDWANRRVAPTPEIIVRNIVGNDLKMMAWKGARGDKRQITNENVVSLDLDWVTHCHVETGVYGRFLEAALPKNGRVEDELLNLPNGPSDVGETSSRKFHDPPSTAAGVNEIPCETVIGGAVVDEMVLGSLAHGLKINLGCGTNKIAGWLNHDSDIDIAKPLPWADASADFIFTEHCVEHVGYKEAIHFFEEALRVLKPGGVLRVTVPSLEQIGQCDDAAYHRFTEKWGKEATRKGAMRAIIYAHGHQVAWTATLMRWTLDYAGFTDIKPCEVGRSEHAALCGVEGHGKVISDRFNRIESMPFEASKPGAPGTSRAPCRGTRVALVVGGSEKVKAELAEAEAMCAGCDVTRFIINDMIPEAIGPCIAVSLHPTKLADWIKRRQANGHPAPSAVWAHRSGPHVTHHTEDWAGSSGLFAIKVARKLGFDRVILCGVPMEPSAKHVVRAQNWAAAISFRKGWEKHKTEIAPFVRSMSGWTAGIFGRPDAGFLEGERKAA